MKIAVHNSILFGKKLMARCNILKNGNKYPCRIYKLDSNDDRHYFYTHGRNVKWANSQFWRELKEDFNTQNPNEETYVLENKSRDCLGIMNIYNTLDCKTKKLAIFQTIPNSKKEGFKYIGETLLAFLAELSEKSSCKKISIPIYKKSAEGFYLKCNFKPNPWRKEELLLNRKKFSDLIKQNKKHTGSDINYIC